MGLRQSLSHLLSSILLTLRLVGELRVQEAQRTKVFLFGKMILHKDSGSPGRFWDVNFRYIFNLPGMNHKDYHETSVYII